VKSKVKATLYGSAFGHTSGTCFHDVHSRHLALKSLRRTEWFDDKVNFFFIRFYVPCPKSQILALQFWLKIISILIDEEEKTQLNLLNNLYLENMQNHRFAKINPRKNVKIVTRKNQLISSIIVTCIRFFRWISFNSRK